MDKAGKKNYVKIRKNFRKAKAKEEKIYKEQQGKKSDTEEIKRKKGNMEKRS